MPDEWSVEALASRLAGADLRGATMHLARLLPSLYRDLEAAVGPDEARRRFDRALVTALAIAT